MRRSARAPMIILAVGAAAFGGAAAASNFRDPAEVLAPVPALQPATVPVASSQLTTVLTARGRVTTIGQFGLRVSSSDPEAIVTRIAIAAGDTVSNGSVLFDLNGVPVVLLQGSIPAYRDLQVGAKGDDVRQLESGLAQLGLLEARRVDTKFDRASARAVDALWGTAGTPESGVARRDHVVYSDQTPAVIDTPQLVVGEAPPPIAATASGGDRAVRAGVDPADRPSVARGAAATIVLPTGTVGGTVDTVAEIVSGSGDPDFAGLYAATITPSDPGVLDGLPDGADVRVDLELASTPTAVLNVPLAAIVVGPDGKPEVTRLNADGTTDDIPVATGVIADGLVEIDPVNGDLRESDNVIVGTTPTATPSSP